jgi:amino acid transporter
MTTRCAMLSEDSGSGGESTPARLPRAMGLLDTTLFLVTAGCTLQWTATAAATGPSSLAAWLIGGLTMFVPLAVCIVYLCSRYPDENGIMSGEIRDPRRTVPKALTLAAPMIAAVYIIGTASILLAIPPERASGVYGVIEAIRTAAAHLGLGWLVPVGAACVVLDRLGSLCLWLGALARIPMSGGIAEYLPRSLQRFILVIALRPTRSGYRPYSYQVVEEPDQVAYLLVFAGEITRPYSEARPRRSNMR